MEDLKYFIDNKEVTEGTFCELLEIDLLRAYHDMFGYGYDTISTREIDELEENLFMEEYNKFKKDYEYKGFDYTFRIK